MESKRKASGLDTNERTSKRMRSDSSSHPLLIQGETAESTTEYGTKFLEMVKRTQDKSKRLVATDFLTLPNKRQYPDYYEKIKLPVALDTIEAKLNRREFPNLAALESYFKRMIVNAKGYNISGSVIHQDAERLRKVLSTWMKENNPAYKLDRNYHAEPTPDGVPGDVTMHDSDIDAEGELDDPVPVVAPAPAPSPAPSAPAPPPAPRGRGRPRGSLNKLPSQRSSTTPALENPYSGKGYAGLSFQQAQEKIIYDLQSETESGTSELKFEVFVDLPPKSLKDYYKVIPNPASLKTILKVVRGSKEGSPFKSWRAYEDEMSLVWKNAFHYNEDGSDIHNLAKQLQAAFYARLAEAKQDVLEPGQVQKIKLKLGPEPTPVSGPQKITLRMSSKASPTVSPAPPTRNDMSSTTINGFSEKTASNGMPQRQPFAASQSSTPAPNIGTPHRAQSLSGSVASPGLPPYAVPLKSEDAVRPSPIPVFPSTNLHAVQNGQHQYFTPNLPMGNSMPPPNTPGFSNSFSGSQSINAYGHSLASSSHTQNASALDSKWRQPGKDDSDALITKVTLNTHNDLNILRHFKMDVLPSPTMTHQSVTITFPSSHYYFQMVPFVSPNVLNRQHKLFVTVNGQRLHAITNVQGGVINREQIFNVRLTHGVNRIEVELIAALPKSAVKTANGPDFELEKVSIYANLLT